MMIGVETEEHWSHSDGEHRERSQLLVSGASTDIRLEDSRCHARVQGFTIQENCAVVHDNPVEGVS